MCAHSSWLTTGSAIDVARWLYCRYSGCGGKVLSEQGYIPTHCADCKREARWTTIPAAGPGDYPNPTKPYELSARDVVFLKALRIDPEWTSSTT